MYQIVMKPFIVEKKMGKIEDMIEIVRFIICS